MTDTPEAVFHKHMTCRGTRGEETPPAAPATGEALGKNWVQRMNANLATGEASPEMTELVRQTIDAAYEWGCAEIYSSMDDATQNDEQKAVEKEKGVDVAEDQIAAAIASLESQLAALRAENESLKQEKL